MSLICACSEMCMLVHMHSYTNNVEALWIKFPCFYCLRRTLLCKYPLNCSYLLWVINLSPRYVLVVLFGFALTCDSMTFSRRLAFSDPKSLRHSCVNSGWRSRWNVQPHILVDSLRIHWILEGKPVHDRELLWRWDQRLLWLWLWKLSKTTFCFFARYVDAV